MKGGYFNALKQQNNSCLQLLADDFFPLYDIYDCDLMIAGDLSHS